jgi:hypothetical protein
MNPTELTHPTSHNALVQWEAFISHAAEDKEGIARPLASELARLGLKVWFDEFTLRVGDRLLKSIDQGLDSSRFGSSF